MEILSSYLLALAGFYLLHIWACWQKDKQIADIVESNRRLHEKLSTLALSVTNPMLAAKLNREPPSKALIDPLKDIRGRELKALYEQNKSARQVPVKKRPTTVYVAQDEDLMPAKEPKESKE